MRRLLVFLSLVVLFAFAIAPQAQASDTGPPDAVEHNLVSNDAEMQTVHFVAHPLETGAIVLSPGDSYTQGYDALIDFQSDYALHTNNRYRIEAPEINPLSGKYRMPKTGNYANRHKDPGRWYHNKA